MKFSGLDTGSTVHTLVLGYDILKETRHAIDYLGTFNATNTDADACRDIQDCDSSSFTTIEVPADNVTVINYTNPNTGLPIVQRAGHFTLWGGTLLSIAYVDYAGGEERQIQLTFTASVENPVLAWGGHIAWAGDWGAN